MKIRSEVPGDLRNELGYSLPLNFITKNQLKRFNTLICSNNIFIKEQLINKNYISTTNMGIFLWGKKKN